MQMMPYSRIFFTKTGRAKYISHLDTMRAMQRAFSRSGLPFWLTQGFNPHIYMTFSLPIALGYKSLCESVDVRFTEEMDFERAVKQLSACLPPGFVVAKIAPPVMNATAITWADYRCVLTYTEDDLPLVQDALQRFLALPVIEVTKRTKKGDKLIDIKPLCSLVSQELDGERLELTLRMRAGGEVNINPTLLLKAFYAWANITPEGVDITRTAIYDADMQIFE